MNKKSLAYLISARFQMNITQLALKYFGPDCKFADVQLHRGDFYEFVEPNALDGLDGRGGFR